jgi:phenolic acid decarboxylase
MRNLIYKKVCDKSCILERFVNLPEEKAVMFRKELVDLINKYRDTLKEPFNKCKPDFFDTDVLDRSTVDLVEVCNSLEYRELTKKEKLSSHGCKMVKLILKEEKIVDFIKLWR